MATEAKEGEVSLSQTALSTILEGIHAMTEEEALRFLRSARVEVYEGEYPATQGNQKGRWYFRCPGRMRKPDGDGHGSRAEAARAAIEELVLDGEEGAMEKPKYVILYKESGAAHHCVTRVMDTRSESMNRLDELRNAGNTASLFQEIIG